MKCEKCSKNAISKNPFLCREHFDDYILQTVDQTIKNNNLFTKKSKILVALSGGKDSLSLVDILSRLNYAVSCIFINEGISGYRETSMKIVKEFTEKRNIPLEIKFFMKEFKLSLDLAVSTNKFHPCTICGTLRRYLLNKYSKNFDIIATGHNLDDGAQTVIINLSRGNTDLFLRLSPKSKELDFFTPRVKPLFFLRDDQLLIYLKEQNIKSDSLTCPNSPISYRNVIKQNLHNLEDKFPGSKMNIVKSYLNFKSKIKIACVEKKILKCSLCGEASQSGICKACQVKKEILFSLKN